MSTRVIEKSVLLKTSGRNDVQNGGGFLSITGLRSVPKKDIESIYQSFYKAEVPQVVTVGATLYAPQAGTVYAVEVYDQQRVDAGYTESPKTYLYRTSSALSVEGASAALQREYISGQLVISINLDATNHSVAASLGSGNGFAVTDDGNYYPPCAQNMSNVKGVNKVIPVTNPDGTGFAATNYSVTTAAVFSSGVGARLLADAPVVDYTFGNLISGTFSAPVTFTNPVTYAVSGQNYDIFGIVSMKVVEGTTLTQQYVYQMESQFAVVDNGTGSSTTNLAGFKAFERQMHKQIAQTYQNDCNMVQEFFDKPMVFQGPLGAAPAGTADVLGWQLSPYGSLNITNIGTQTIVAPVLDATGLLIDQDDTATEGSHVSANQQTLGGQSFIVGQQAFSLWARVVAGDWTDAAFMVGFRKKAVYGAVINNYTDYATVGNGSSVAGTTWINGDLFVTRANINGGTTLQAISAVVPADGVSVLLQVKVALNGAVTAFVNGTSYPIYSVGTTALVFDAGDEMIPFYQIVNIGGGDPAASISEFVAVASTDVLS